MELIKEFLDKHGREAAIGGGIALSLASSLYLYKRLTAGPADLYQDPAYKVPNLPLY